MVRELLPEELRLECDPATLEFQTTAELPAADGTIADQERAAAAIECALNLPGRDSHVVAVGPGGVGRMTLVEQIAREFAKTQPAPPDVVLVANFDEPGKPQYITLPPGTGLLLAEAMAALTKPADPLAEPPQARLIELANAVIESEGIQRTRDQVVAEFEKMKDPQKARAFMSGAAQKLREKIAAQILKSLRRELADVLEKCGQSAADFVKAVAYDLAFTIHAARHATQQGESMPAGFLDRYRVNLITRRKDTEGAPVVVVEDPSFVKLFGRIDFDSVRQEGTESLTATHMSVVPGALQEANGGVLIVELRPLLLNSGAYEMLKLALKSGKLETRSLAQVYGLVPIKGLELEPIPLDVKVIVVAEPRLCHALEEVDTEFTDLFRVPAIFATQTDRDGAEKLYAGFIKAREGTDGIRPLTAAAVAAVIEHGSRMAESQKKVSLLFGEVDDLLKEASLIAHKNGHDAVTAEDVQQAIVDAEYRLGAAEERLREVIAEGTIFISTTGAKVGVGNGLSYLESTRGYAFGTPLRVTVRTYAGKNGVVDIMRESKLSGSSHTKGVFTLAGCLGGIYAQKGLLSLTASISFEQCGPVDGDSATALEFFTLISSLAGVPLKQSIAVTGSMNQHGEIQPIGGVTHKVEGWFYTCLLMEGGLTGEQGVIIPAANVKHLMLRQDVIDAVRQGLFHVWAIETVDEGLELLTGLPAGKLQEDGTYPEGTVHRAVADKLARFAEASPNGKNAEPTSFLDKVRKWFTTK